MFHNIKTKPILFSSNPPLDPLLMVDLDVNENGDPVNRYSLKERQHPLRGLHYDPQTMSLRAMIKLGFQFQPVHLGQTENDPNNLASSVKRMTSQIKANYDSRQVVEETHVETPKTE